MATIGATNPTLLDQIKRMAPDGSIAKIVEALSERNDILKDAVAIEANMPLSHRTTIREGLPEVGWRMFNQGIAASKSQTIQVDETIGMLEGRSKVDVDLAKLNGNEAAVRASEDMAFIQSMNNTISTALFYESTRANPERIMGLTPRYNLLAGDNAANIINDLSSSSGSDQYSMWFVTWGEDTCHLIYPKGSQVGLQQKDLGEQLVADSGGTNEYKAYVTNFQWKLGLCVKDWRYCARICNIDASATLAAAAGTTTIITSMVRAYNAIQDFNSGRTVIYCSRALRTLLDIQILNKTNVFFTPMEWHGHTGPSFRGLPILICDALVAEAIQG